MNPVPVPAILHLTFDEPLGAPAVAPYRTDTTHASAITGRRASGGLDSSQGSPRWGA